MEEWKEYKANDFCLKVTDGTHDSPKPKANGKHYLITSKHLKSGSIDFSSAYKISEEDYQKVIERSKVEKFDILFSMIGTIGNIYRESSDDIEYAVKNMAIFKCGGDSVKSSWLYYWLQSPKAKEYINSRLTGSTQGYLTLDTLRNFPIDFPSFQTAIKIVSILSSIDDKIEVNKKINSNLEEQAKALFKSWFIDFEPFKGGKFVDSELGMIPEGWKVGRYDDIIEGTIAGDWGKEKSVGNYLHEVTCIRGCDFQDIKNGLRGNAPTRFILEKNFKNKRFVSHDILVEISGGTQAVSTGRVCSISQKLIDTYNGNVVCTNFCRVVRPAEGYSAFAYYSWLYKYDQKVMFGYENGTSGIKNFRLNDFLSMEPLIIPPKNIVIEFQNFIDGINSQMQTRGGESSKLENIRDSLLPKLMSGEIEVK
ncbi:MAG: restriction endonuclease subunit S [Prevotella sp.]|jgi:type I restriction enzyme S subunit|nr:restriction endonuclease subunit S [Prevotella sp.]